MANQEIYDYVSIAVPDNSTTLSVTPQSIIQELGSKNVEIHEGDDGSEERIILSSTSVFYVTLSWTNKSESDIGTVLNYYHNAAAGNGMSESFLWEHPTDGHTYVVRFASDVRRDIMMGNFFGITNVRLKILGRIAD